MQLKIRLLGPVATALRVGLLVACCPGAAGAQEPQRATDAEVHSTPDPESPAGGLRGSIDGAPRSTGSASAAADSDSDARIADLERKAEAASRISDLSFLPPREPKRAALRPH